uniref:Uncharacterized protein n=1 Tax=Anguilla anguilla TaxID=7936 RepID=A0A0E9TA51_ANGAN
MPFLCKNSNTVVRYTQRCSGRLGVD